MDNNNVFPLENATMLSCVIQNYSIGHSSLWINVLDKPEISFFLYFSNVQYLSAPMGWDSASFTIASSKECEDLLIKLDYPPALASRYAKDSFKLYEIQKESFKIQIVASSVSKLSSDHVLAPKT